MHVYMIICDCDISPVTGTGKYYVGKTVQPDLKKYLAINWSAAQRGLRGKPYLYNAMRKHSDPSNWRIHSLMSTLPSDPEIKKWEVELIAMFKCREPQIGYNLTAGGDGASIGNKLAANAPVTEARRQASRRNLVAWNISQKGAKRPDLAGRSFSDSTRTKMSEAWTPERRAAHAESLRGRKLSVEVKAKISASRNRKGQTCQ
jgi:hypothetical protein